MSKIFAVRIEKSLYTEIKAKNSDEAVDKALEEWKKNPPIKEIFVEGEYEEEE